MTGWGGCSTAQVDPQNPLPQDPPDYVKVPHAEGLDMGDLEAIFHTTVTPPYESLKECDKDFVKLRTLTQSRTELIQGARELIRADATLYHWCFYSKLRDLETDLKKSDYIEDRQKSVLTVYLFVGPMARAFLLEFNDSRYLRWAIARYRRLSEYVFYRSVDLSPDSTQELLSAANPFGLARQPASTEGNQPREQGILEKYGIVKPVPAPSPNPSSVQKPVAPVKTASIPTPEKQPEKKSDQTPAPSPEEEEIPIN